MNPLIRPDPFNGVRDALAADDLPSALPAGPIAPDSTPRPSRPVFAWQGAVVAWLVIVSVAGYIIYRQGKRQGDPAAALAESIVTMQMQSRYLVGAASLGLPGAGREAMYKQASASLDQGSYSQRLRFAVLAGELSGPEEALAALKRLEQERVDGQLEARDVSVEAARKLETLYAGYRLKPGEADLPAGDQEWLRSRLGWFGELALAPREGDPVARTHAIAPALRTLVVYLAVLGFGLLGFCVGCFLLLLFALLAILGRLHGGLQCGSRWGGVYAETFALYLLSFIVLSLAFRYVPIPQDLQMGAGTLATFLSLLVLLWPLIRGISWAQLRADLGLNVGGSLLSQLLSGVGCYLDAIPLLVAGALVTLLLMLAQRWLGLGDPFQSGGGPSHPIILEVMGSGPWVWLQIFLAACVAAPIVEEIMFRGVLYRHLREASHRWGRIASIVFSALLSSFVFAAIHPQGWLGVPRLMALAIAFCLAREWRQSLVAPMIAHGINNGVITLMLLLTAV